MESVSYFKQNQIISFICINKTSFWYFYFELKNYTNDTITLKEEKISNESDIWKKIKGVTVENDIFLKSVGWTSLIVAEKPAVDHSDIQ